jgi:hypothetical protein
MRDELYLLGIDAMAGATSASLKLVGVHPEHLPKDGVFFLLAHCLAQIPARYLPLSFGQSKERKMLNSFTGYKRCL